MEEKYQRSWNHFTCALVTDPNYVPALEGRAVINLQMGNLFGSFLDISSAIKISPTAELYTNRGVIHQVQKYHPSHAILQCVNISLWGEE